MFVSSFRGQTRTLARWRSGPIHSDLRILVALRAPDKSKSRLANHPWDTHTNIRKTLPDICRRTDKPAAALVKDLKQRGLLETTLVHWGGEIGRLPVCEGDLNAGVGRDHNGQGFSIWMAGGGIKGGMTYGETDEVGHKAAVNVVTPNDYQATVLHLLGVDHSKLVFTHNGRAQRLTDGRAARVVKEILA